LQLFKTYAFQVKNIVNFLKKPHKKININTINLKQKNNYLKLWVSIFSMILICGQSKTYGNYIDIGVTIDLSRGARQLGKNARNGIELAIKNGNDDENAFKLAWFDDKYSSSIARKNVEKMIEDKIQYLLCPIGMELMHKYLDLIEQGKILLLFPMPSLLDADLPYCINFGPNYKEYAEVVTQHLISTSSPKKTIILYQNDVAGKCLLSATKKKFAESNVSVIAHPFKRNYVQLKEEIDFIKKEKPDHLGIFGPPHIVKKIINGLGDIICQDICFFITVLENNELYKYMKNKKLKFTGANVIPDPETSNLPVMVEFCKLATENNIKIDMTAVLAYICTSLFMETISKLKDKSPEKCYNKFMKFSNYNFKGLNLTFIPTKNRISNKLWLYTVEGTWEEKNM